MRGWLNEARSYIPPVKIGEVMRAGTLGEVVNSKNSKFKKGDILSGWGGFNNIRFQMVRDILRYQTLRYPYQLILELWVCQE